MNDKYSQELPSHPAPVSILKDTWELFKESFADQMFSPASVASVPKKV